MEWFALAGMLLKTANILGRKNDISPCHTRILRGGRGAPWNHQVAIHTTLDGKVELIKIPD
jgi:hypothetical protein